VELDSILSNLEAADFTELVRRGGYFKKGSILNSYLVNQSLLEIFTNWTLEIHDIKPLF
jgi:hypothetical protein